MQPETLLDVRVPQPGREGEYGVPSVIVEAAAHLYRQRSQGPANLIPTIDAAILRLYSPWISKDRK